jgi:hypothetical protein
MKKGYMRPQDIVILLKIVALKENSWRQPDLANQLLMSQAEISNSLYRSSFAGLIDQSKKNVQNNSLYDFLIYGIKYVFPQKPGAIVRGMPTSHSALPLSKSIQSSNVVYVWPDNEGSVRGEAIEPLYPTVPKAAKIDQPFYELMVLVDAVRVGKSRENQIAVLELKKRILGNEKQ